MANSVISAPVSHNINNIKSKFKNNYDNFRKYNTLLTSSYVNNTPHTFYENIKNNMENIDNLYTIGVLYKDDNNDEYDSQYTITGSPKQFELKNYNDYCNDTCQTYMFQENGYKICSCVLLRAVRREIEEEIGLTFINDNIKPINIIKNQMNNKYWCSFVFNISQFNSYKPQFIHNIFTKNKYLYTDINKFKIQAIILGTENEIINKLSEVTKHRIGHESDIIGVTLCKFTDLEFNK